MITQLQQLGLNEKEAKVYLASLELGQSTVQEIAKKAGINRPTSYFIIDGLMKRGLVSSFHKGKKQYFVAADPDKLEEILEKEKSNIEERKRDLGKILPQLQSLRKKEGPVVRYYEGKEGITTMVKEFLEDTNEVVRMVYSNDAIHKVFGKPEREKWRDSRLHKGIKTKVIYTWNEGIMPSTPDGERRKIPSNKFPTSCDIAVYGNKVRLASLGDRLSGVIIEDKEIADSIKAIFDLAWEAAEKYKE